MQWWSDKLDCPIRFLERRKHIHRADLGDPKISFLKRRETLDS